MNFPFEMDLAEFGESVRTVLQVLSFMTLGIVASMVMTNTIGQFMLCMIGIIVVNAGVFVFLKGSSGVESGKKGGEMRKIVGHHRSKSV